MEMGKKKIPLGLSEIIEDRSNRVLRSRLFVRERSWKTDSIAYSSGFKPFSSRGTSISLLILLWNLNVQHSTIYSIFKEPPGVIGGTSSFRETQVEKHWPTYLHPDQTMK